MDDAMDQDRFGGWVLRSTEPDAVVADLKTYGQVFRFPLPPGDRAAEMDAGQPCFLYVEVADQDGRSGIWAVGEVVGRSHPDDVPGARPGTLTAEVELIPLATRLTRDVLRGNRGVVGCELFRDPGRPNPYRLSRAEVRALEEFEFDLREPTGDQIRAVDEVLGHESDTSVLTRLFEDPDPAD